jgi:hypothetical protein
VVFGKMVNLEELKTETSPTAGFTFCIKNLLIEILNQIYYHDVKMLLSGMKKPRVSLWLFSKQPKCRTQRYKYPQYLVDTTAVLKAQ